MEMTGMESPRIEPLLFSDLGGFVVHNVWTWVALLSAAIGFFGLRLFPVPSTTTSSSRTNPFASKTRSDDDHSTSATTPSSSLPDDPTSSHSTTTTTISACTTTTEIAIDGCCRIRRRKITVAYYRDEEDDDVAEEEEEEEIGVDDDVDFGGICGGYDDVVMRWQEASRCAELEYEVVVMRMREMGWYKFQDLSVLDGSAVRLWEAGGRRPTITAAAADGWLIR